MPDSPKKPNIFLSFLPVLGFGGLLTTSWFAVEDEEAAVAPAAEAAAEVGAASCQR